jgi:hypothetical protein
LATQKSIARSPGILLSQPTLLQLPRGEADLNQALLSQIPRQELISDKHSSFLYDLNHTPAGYVAYSKFNLDVPVVGFFAGHQSNCGLAMINVVCSHLAALGICRGQLGLRGAMRPIRERGSL